jgi:hypothetical protein
VEDDRPDRRATRVALEPERSASRARRSKVRTRPRDDDHKLTPVLEPFMNAFVDMIVEDLLARPPEEDP